MTQLVGLGDVEMATDEVERAVVDVRVPGVDLGESVDVGQADGAVRRGAGIAADGVALGQAPVLQLRENVKLTTSHPEHAWVNQIQIWASGTVDL